MRQPERAGKEINQASSKFHPRGKKRIAEGGTNLPALTRRMAIISSFWPLALGNTLVWSFLPYGTLTANGVESL
jgi:hypothetical protein